MTDEREPIAADPGDPANPTSAAAAKQTVVNDAVAGETVTDGAGTVRDGLEARPASDEFVPANDGYLAPRHETGETSDIDLDDQRDETPEVRTSRADDAGGETP